MAFVDGVVVRAVLTAAADAYFDLRDHGKRSDARAILLYVAARTIGCSTHLPSAPEAAV